MAHFVRHTRDVCSWRIRRSHYLSAPDGCCLVGIIASHIPSRRRLEFFDHCLRSIGLQTRPPDALYISWYAEQHLAADVDDLLRRLHLSCRITLLRQTQRRSQYEHIKLALASVERDTVRCAACTWIVFSDDDDLCHPERFALVRVICAGACSSTDSLGFGVYAYPLRSMTKEEEAETWHDVKGIFDLILTLTLALNLNLNQPSGSGHMP